MNETHITQTRQVKCLGLRLNTQLTWKQDIKSIIDKIRIKRRQMYWLTSRNSKLSIENKLKIYKAMIKPICTYGIPLWRRAVMSRINKLELLRSKIFRTIVLIQKDLKIPLVKEEIGRYAKKYKKRMTTHQNQLTAEASKTHKKRRLKRKHPIGRTKEMK